MKLKIDNGKIIDIYNLYQDTKLKNENLTWDKFAQIANQHFGYDFGESAYRKQIAKYQKELINIQSPLENLLKADIRNQYQVEIKKQLNREYKELRKDFLRNEDIREAIKKMVAPSDKEVPLIEVKKTNKVSVFLIGDNQENGSNWSKSIYQWIYQEISERVKKEKLKEIYLIDLGDGIEGFLRTSDLALNKDSVMKQLHYYQNATALLLERLSEMVKVNFAMVLSNHTQSRSMGAKVNELRNHDYTFLVINFLQAYLRDNPNINWLNGIVNDVLEMDYISQNIKGFGFLFTHGQDRMYKPNNPKLTMFNVSQYHSDVDIDYLVYGHYHNFNFNHLTVNYKNNADRAVIINGALDIRMSKSNEKSAGLSSKPMFTRLVVSENEGITQVDKIFVPKELWK